MTFLFEGGQLEFIGQVLRWATRFFEGVVDHWSRMAALPVSEDCLSGNLWLEILLSSCNFMLPRENWACGDVKAGGCYSYLHKFPTNIWLTTWHLGHDSIKMLSDQEREFYYVDKPATMSLISTMEFLYWWDICYWTGPLAFLASRLSTVCLSSRPQWVNNV